MRVYLAIVLCLCTFTVLASKKAVTEEGDVVILHFDGTWTYENGEMESIPKIAVNDAKFVKGDKENFLLKSTKTDAAFWINPKSWSFKKSDNCHEVAEYTFKLKQGGLYGMVIAEPLAADKEGLVNIAIDNARQAASDVKVIKQEYRTVNGLDVIYMEMQGTVQSIKFTYLGYYYSDSSGSVQFLTYTGSNLIDKYQDDINSFLNGFTTQ